jgi:hypothetical protein
LNAKTEADAIRLEAIADADVVDAFTREMELRRVEVQRVAANGKAVFVLEGATGNAVQRPMTMGPMRIGGWAQGERDPVVIELVACIRSIGVRWRSDRGPGLQWDPWMGYLSW